MTYEALLALPVGTLVRWRPTSDVGHLLVDGERYGVIEDRGSGLVRWETGAVSVIAWAWEAAGLEAVDVISGVNDWPQDGWLNFRRRKRDADW
jgi:hypothetical protein